VTKSTAHFNSVLQYIYLPFLYGVDKSMGSPQSRIAQLLIAYNEMN
jgi:hypothetical protein